MFQEPVFQEPVFQEPGGLGDPYNAEAALTELVHERDDEIESLQTALDDREKEKEAHQEELTELRRSVILGCNHILKTNLGDSTGRP